MLVFHHDERTKAILKRITGAQAPKFGSRPEETSTLSSVEQVSSLSISFETIPMICAISGTGGSLSGTATYLNKMNPGLRVVLSDPEGSGLYNRVKYGVMFDVKEKEGRKRR
jgi:cysteine synthase